MVKARQIRWHGEAGVGVPPGWDETTLGQIGECIIGLTYSPDDVVDHGHLVLRSSNIRDHRLVYGNDVYVRGPLPPRVITTNGDILVCVRNGSRALIGKCALIEARSAGHAFGAFMSVYRTSFPQFVFQLFQAESIRKQIRDNIGATINQITNRDMRALRVQLPPLPEQRAIAEALGDVDALIDSLDRLIAKKRDLKQGAMQQLLTGKTRLPGFRGEWNTTTLGEIGAWFSGGTPSHGRDEYWAGEIPWVSPKDMKVFRLLDATDHVSELALSNGTRLLPRGALLIVVRGMILAHACPVARAEHPLAFNQDIKGLVVHNTVDSDFVLWWLLSQESALLSRTTMSTHGTKRLPSEDLYKVEIRLPPISEQSAIAVALSDMDTEITVLQQRLQKTRWLKQGMMQELLTGKTRLV